MEAAARRFPSGRMPSGSPVVLLMADVAKSRLKASAGIALVALAALVVAGFWRESFARPEAWREALLVAVIFAVGGWVLRGVSATGALAGAMVAFMMNVLAGRRMFAVLFSVFVLTLAATLAGRGRKQTLGLAEPSSGRSAAQVAANLFVATAALLLLPASIAVVVAVAALAEAAADTVSSEIGEAFGRQTYLITTMRPTTPGTNGGVSIVGTLAGVGAAACVAAMALLMIDVRLAVIAGAAGVFGMLADSVLGATLEKRGYLNNDAVNLLGTAAAAGVAWAFVGG